MLEDSFIPLTLARILRPWGRRGEVAAEVLTDFPQRLTERREAWLAAEGRPPRRVKILSCRLHLGQAIFHFEGVESISDAQTLRGYEVQVPLADRAPAGEGRHYITDLIGCAICEEGSAAPLGIVQDVQRGGEASGDAVDSWTLVVVTPRGELLIPLAAEICTHIDTVARRIEVRLPEGLRDLNAP